MATESRHGPDYDDRELTEAADVDVDDQDIENGDSALARRYCANAILYTGMFGWTLLMLYAMVLPQLLVDLGYINGATRELLQAVASAMPLTMLFLMLYIVLRVLDDNVLGVWVRRVLGLAIGGYLLFSTTDSTGFETAQAAGVYTFITGFGGIYALLIGVGDDLGPAIDYVHQRLTNNDPEVAD